jgi:excisionase family DNA binding protein
VPPRFVPPRSTQEVHHYDGNPANTGLDNLTVVSRTEALLTVQQAAQHLGVAPSTVFRWLRSGKLGTASAGFRGACIPASEVVRLLEEQQRGRRWMPRP